MASLNSFNFTGRLGRDPELKTLDSGTTLCRLSVAVDRFGDKPSVWIDVTVWGKAAEHCANYLAKGRQVAVSGQVDEVRAYQKKDGEPGASLCVSTRDVTFIGGRDDAQSSGSSASAPAPQATDEDDIPF